MYRLWKLISIVLSVVPTPFLPFIRRFSSDPELENNFYVTTEGDNVPLRIYHPPDLDMAPAIIIYPGASPDAEEHEAVNVLAKAMASIGIRTFLPRIPALKKVLIRESSVEHMINVYLAVADRHDVDPDRIIGCGVSFGGSLFIKACLDDRLKGKPASVVSYGSYFDFTESVRFSMTGKSSDGEKEYYCEPHDWGRIAFFHNYLEHIDDRHNPNNLHKYLVDRIINDGKKSKNLYDSFPNEDRILIDKIAFGRSESALQIGENILQRIKPITKTLSPSTFIDEINFPIFMMHGFNDTMIPFTETVKFARALENKGKEVNSFISYIYSHSTIEEHKKGVIGFLAELWRMGKFLKSMLRPVL